MTPDDEIHSSEDEAVASDLDMHALILGGLHQDHECPVKTADEVCCVHLLLDIQVCVTIVRVSLTLYGKK